MASIILNGKKTEIEAPTTVETLLKSKNIRPEVVTVEVNDKIIERQDYSKTEVKDGDRVEFVFFMGGGVFNYYE